MASSLPGDIAAIDIANADMVVLLSVFNDDDRAKFDRLLATSRIALILEQVTTQTPLTFSPERWIAFAERVATPRPGWFVGEDATSVGATGHIAGVMARVASWGDFDDSGVVVARMMEATAVPGETFLDAAGTGIVRPDPVSGHPMVRLPTPAVLTSRIEHEMLHQTLSRKGALLGSAFLAAAFRVAVGWVSAVILVSWDIMAPSFAATVVAVTMVAVSVAATVMEVSSYRSGKAALDEIERRHGSLNA